MTPVLRTAFGIIGNVSALAQFLSPMNTFYKIYKSRSTESFSSLPYVVTFINCAMWIWYGIPVVTKNNLLVITVNSTGVVIQTFYITIFLFFAPPKKKLKTMQALFACIVFLGIVIMVTLVLLHGGRRKLFVGTLCAILNSCVYASPLSIMRLVITSKSVKYMPFLLSLSIFINCIAWTIYAILGHDIFVLIPSALGCILGLLQLILYTIYMKANKQHKEDSLKPSTLVRETIEEKPNGEVDLSSISVNVGLSHNVGSE